MMAWSEMKALSLAWGAVARWPSWVRGQFNKSTLSVWLPDALALLFLCVSYAVVFFAAQRNPLGVDDSVYFEYARGIQTGAPHHQQRFIVLGTVWLAQAIFGYTTTAYYAVPFVYSLALILACYFAARALLGVSLSLISAFMVMMLPTYLVSATWPMPDIPSLFWLVLAIAVLVRALTSDSPGLPITRGVASGLFFWLAVSARESSALLLPGLVCFPLALRSKRAWQVLLIAATTTVVLELIQMVVLWHIFGDPWYRLHAVVGGQLPQMEKYVRTGSGIPKHVQWVYLATRFYEAFAQDRHFSSVTLLGFGYWSWLVWSLPVAVVWAALMRQRMLLALLGFIVWCYLVMSFTPLSLDPLIPAIRTRPRYFLSVLVWVPMLTLAGWSCFARWLFSKTTARQWSRLRIALGALCSLYVGVAVATGWTYLSTATTTVRSGFTPLEDFYAAVHEFRKTGMPVQRVLGPRVLRAASFAWPKHDIPVVWRTSRPPRGKRLARAKDFFITEEHPAQELETGLWWRAVGSSATDRFHYYYLDSFRSPLRAGRYGLVAEDSKDLGKLSRARLSVRLEVQARSLEVGPVAVQLLKDGKPVTVQWLPWEHERGAYSIHVTTLAFSTEDVRSVFLTFELKGEGRARLRRHRFRLRDASSQR